MTKQEVELRILAWISRGDIVSVVGLGVSHAEVNRRVAAKELFRTSYSCVLATNKAVRDEFEALVDEGRVLDINACAAKKDLLTAYAIKKACDSGDLIRVDLQGKQSILFID